jgi:PIN domain nuclease of toxin-antitoxin system
VSELVLDASALLALLNDEPGAEVVASHLDGAVVSAVNISEVVAKLADAGVPPDVIRAALDELDLEVLPFDTLHAYAAGELRPLTRHLGLSFGDRACLAVGQVLGRPVLTTDRNWQTLKLPIPVHLVR